MKHSNLRFPALFFSLCSLCLCGELFAEQSEIDELRRRIEELERRLSTIEAADDGGAAAHGAFAGWEEGRFTLRSADSDYELKVGGHIQVDGRFPFDGPRAGENQIFVPRVRMIFDGRVARFFEYEIEYEFGRGFGPAGDDRSPRLLDAYLNFAFIDQAQIKAGRYKVPFSIDELVSSDSTRLIRRSIINRFAPSRETGVTIQGDAGGVSYAAGVFDDDAPDDFLYAGRFTLEPGIFAPEFWVAVNGYYEHNRGVAVTGEAFWHALHRFADDVFQIRRRCGVGRLALRARRRRRLLGHAAGFAGGVYRFRTGRADWRRERATCSPANRRSLMVSARNDRSIRSGGRGARSKSPRVTRRC